MTQQKLKLTTSKPQSKRTLFYILFLFIVPFIAARIIYGYHLWPEHRTNLGILAEPALPIHELVFNTESALEEKPLNAENMGRRWWLLYVTESGCNESCQNVLHLMRNIDVALGKDTHRVERLFVSSEELPEILKNNLREKFPEMHQAVSEQRPLKNLLRQVTGHEDVLNEHNVYIIDPLGNLMMVYPEHLVGQPIIKDLTRLLKYSQIG